MMEKAIKQRLLGGLVLVAGAALFLPVLLDGSGAGLTIPPMPKAPEVGGVESLAPRLDQKVAETEQAVDAAHAGREEAAADSATAATAGEGAGDVAPDAAALAASDGAAATASASSQVVKPATAAAAVPAAVAKAPLPAPAAAKSAAAAGDPVKPAAPGAAAPQSLAVAPAKPVPAAVPAKPAALPAPAPAPAKPAAPATATAKPAETKPSVDKALPGAWLVQVGVFSSRDKAQALVQQLRRKGYAAVLNPQGGSFKVVVGPELNRSVADSIKARLAADPELKLNGWVQAYKP